MARVITKELAEKIVKKLKAIRINSRAKAHDLYEFRHGGLLVATISIRRGSEKDKGHDFIPDEIHLGPNQAKNLANCPLSLDAYIQILREKGVLPAAEE